MITFKDGPAIGQTLMCRHAPMWLRVVQGPDGQWDALDKSIDMPRLSETIYLYRRVGDVGSLHVRMQRGRGGHSGGYFATAQYEFVEPQPEEEVMRGIRVWKMWLAERAEG